MFEERNWRNLWLQVVARTFCKWLDCHGSQVRSRVKISLSTIRNGQICQIQIIEPNVCTYFSDVAVAVIVVCLAVLVLVIPLIVVPLALAIILSVVLALLVYGCCCPAF